MPEDTTPGPVMPKRIVVIDVPGYPGFTAKMWANMPNRLLLDLESGDVERAENALRQIVVEHNGWCDQEGEPLPPADDPAFWDALPQELAAVIVRGCIPAAVAQLPNSLAPRRRSSGSTSAPSTGAPASKA